MWLIYLFNDECLLVTHYDHYRDLTSVPSCMEHGSDVSSIVSLSSLTLPLFIHRAVRYHTIYEWVGCAPKATQKRDFHFKIQKPIFEFFHLRLIIQHVGENKGHYAFD